jgi:hypothetical protein
VRELPNHPKREDLSWYNGVVGRLFLRIVRSRIDEYGGQQIMILVRNDINNADDERRKKGSKDRLLREDPR